MTSTEIVKIDLCGECLDPLTDYIKGGRPVRTEWVTPAGGRSAGYQRRTAAIRVWAVEHELLEPGSNGRLPSAVIAAYDAAHGGAR